MKKNEVYTELSIQIGVLQATVDKVLKILLEQQKPYIINNDFVGIDERTDLEEFKRILSRSKPFQSSIMTTEDFDREFK